MSETTKKMLKEIVYYFPDHRANASHALAAEGFVLDAATGDSAELNGASGGVDVLTWKGRTITVRAGWVYRTVRLVEKKEPAKDAVKLD